MTSLAAEIGEHAAARKPVTRGDLSGFLNHMCRNVGADKYMLVAILHDQDRSDVRIIASNWIYDSIQAIGHNVIATVSQNAATSAGNRPGPIRTGEATAVFAVVSPEQATLLNNHDHAELYCLRLDVGRQRFFLILSAELPDQIDHHALRRAQLQCSYALSPFSKLLAPAPHQDPLSDRERECLFWVSEGKTTDEVAVIFGVSSNTVSSYITHAIQKFAASNRAMAIATAIRNGII
jgi:DNA-binding CsgD family transcriptional regulator